MAKSRSDAERRVRQSQRLGRTLRLLCLIQERHSSWNLDSLAQELSCSRKTIQRDLQVLESAGVPYFYDEVACCYRVRPDFRLPILETSQARSSDAAGEVSTMSAEQSETPLMLAELSQETAERLLSQAERLINTLSKLCQTLRQSGQSSSGDSRSKAK
jgi:predicted DNA-binding transcriptional regulator YafY